MPEISNLLFDFGNVIIDIDVPGAIERIGSLRHPDVEEAKFERYVMELVYKYEVDAVSTDLFINGILKHADRNVQALDVIQAWNSMLVDIPEYRLTMLEQLKPNYGLYMLSNTNYLHIEWVHDHLSSIHFEDDFEGRYFHEVYYSHLIKARKPHAEAFEHVINEAMISPERTLFIDDNEENIETAKSLGFKTLLSPPEKDVTEALKLMDLY